MTQSQIEFCSTTMQRRYVVQVGLDVDSESVTSPEQQVMVPCETAMCEEEMFSPNQLFCDASCQLAVNKESNHVTQAVSSNVGHAPPLAQWYTNRLHARLSHNHHISFLYRRNVSSHQVHVKSSILL